MQSTQAHNLGSPGIVDTRPSAIQQNPRECQHDLLLPKTFLPVDSMHCGGSWGVNLTIKHWGSINLPFPLISSHTHTPQPQPLALNVSNSNSHWFWDSYVKQKTETCWLCFCHHCFYLLSIGFCIVSWSFKVIACCKCRIQLLQSSADDALWENKNLHISYIPLSWLWIQPVWTQGQFLCSLTHQLNGSQNKRIPWEAQLNTHTYTHTY